MYPLTWRQFTWNWWDDNKNGIPDVPGLTGDHYEEAYGDTPLAMISTAYLDAIDPKVKVPYVDEITLGIEHELVKDLRVSARYIHKDRARILGSVLWDKDSDRYWYTQDLAPEWWIPFTTTVPETGSYPAQEVTMYFLSNDAPDQFNRLTNIPEAKLKYDSVELGFDKRLAQRDVSRRDFLKFCGLMAGTLALPARYAGRIAHALETAVRPPVVWLNFQDCTADTESFLRCNDPAIVDVLFDVVSRNYHETLMSPAGAAARK
jgi:hypothetical protein